MAYDRNVVVAVMRSWLGKNEASGSHREIIDIYNTIRPLPGGYTVKYNDSWCATTVSAAFHKVGYDKIFPMECSCSRMITKAKSMGIWMENDSYVPSPGDCIMYDWQDSGVGENVGYPEHVGMVESCDGKKIVVIEGNYKDSVGRRTINVDGRYIRGFIIPKFTTTQQIQKPQTQSVNTSANAEYIWKELMKQIGNPYGVAGIMGNLQAESGLSPINLQNSANKKFGVTDEQYTVLVDSSAYLNFANDSCGYGIAQWTSSGRKQALMNYCKSMNKSIGDLSAQTSFLIIELQQNPKIMNVLKTATSVRVASDCILTQYERPKDQSEVVKALRCSYGEEFFKKFANKVQNTQNSVLKYLSLENPAAVPVTAKKKDDSIVGQYQTTANLRLRTDAGKNATIIGTMKKGARVMNYGYYNTDEEGTDWYFITVDGYKGYASEVYLERV